jgi:hypothetical protein
MLPRHKIQYFVKLSRVREYIALLMFAVNNYRGNTGVTRPPM